jgi:triacylglycerol lipase
MRPALTFGPPGGLPCRIAPLLRHHIYFAPGMFGFGRLGSYDYFVHLERALVRELRARGEDALTWVVDVPPTASVRRRAGRLAELVAATSDASGEEERGARVHLVGHSTGGADVRLLASPGAHLPCDEAALAWLPRLTSVTTLSTPHYGTPLAAFFTTVSGQRMLYALSALTFIALTLGSPPLAAASALVVAVGRMDRALGLEIRLLARATDRLLTVLDDARSHEVRAYLDAIEKDQGAMVQLMPEAMELFQASVLDRPGVRYQCTASMAPPPSPGKWARQLVSPWGTLSMTIFAALWELTARRDERYPCGAPHASEKTEALLAAAFGQAPGVRANDGVVPLRSQLHGDLVWTGYADHLDVLGHFAGAKGRGAAAVVEGAEPPHVDWLRSGAAFDEARFATMTKAIVAGMLAPRGEGASAR